MSVFRRLMLPLVLAVVLLLAPAGCAREVQAPPTSARPAIDVVLGPSGASLMPYSPLLANRQVGALVFAGLLSPGPDGQPIPDLCAEVPTRDNDGISADGLIMTYVLRTDARWHDGRAVTTADVIFTWSLLQSGKMVDDPARDLSQVRSVEALDDHTLRVVFTRPATDLGWVLMPYVLPQHLLGSSPDLASDPYWIAPVGCGPFSVESPFDGSAVTLRPVEGTGPDLRVLFAQTAGAAREAFDASFNAVWLHGAMPLSGSAETEATTTTVARSAFLFNQASDRVTADVRVRRVIRAVLEGRGGSTESTGALEAALSDAGWTQSATGIRRRGALTLGLDIVTPPLRSDQGARVEAFVARLRALGFDAAFRVDDDIPLGSFGDAGTLATGDFDVLWTSVWIGPGQPWPWSASDHPSASRPNGMNAARVADPELERIHADLVRSTDASSARAAWAAALGRIDDRAYVAWDGQGVTRVLFRGVENVTAHHVPAESLASAPAWRLR
ncbi:MAG: ABC transporter substrate-binding protein [Coriobacteriia bacterium]